MSQAMKDDLALRLIVNADDLGKSAAVNDAIFECMDQGTVSSSTIMANGAAVDDAVRRSKLFPHCSFGVHLVATEFFPLSDNSRLSALLTPDKQFYKWPRKALLNPATLAALFHEFGEQISSLERRGLKISHIDSHHHIHVTPQFFPILPMLCRRFSIRRMRNARNLYQPDEHVPVFQRAAKTTWASALHRIGGLVLPDYFGTLEDLKSQAPEFGMSKTAEIMLHPGHDGYSLEHVATKGKWHQDLPFSAKLTNFNEL